MKEHFFIVVSSLLAGFFIGILFAARTTVNSETPTEWKDGGLIKHDKAVYRLVVS